MVDMYGRAHRKTVVEVSCILLYYIHYILSSEHAQSLQLDIIMSPITQRLKSVQIYPVLYPIHLIITPITTPYLHINP